MRKIYFILFSVFTAGISNAQITLNSTNAPAAGDLFSYVGIDTTGVKLGSPGPAVTWDFSAATKTTTKYSTQYVSAASTPYAANFPSATIAIQSGTAYSYYAVSASGNIYLGSQSTAGSPNILSNSEKVMAYSFTYTNTYSDTYAGHTYAGQDSLNGTFSGLADAYGTLKLPGGVTYNNTLRVKTIDTSIDTIYFAESIHYTYTTYNWYVTTQHNPACYIQYVSSFQSMMPGTINKTASMAMSYTSGLGINELGQENITTNIYPNPSASGQANVLFTLKNDGETTVSIVNTLGQTAKTIAKGNLQAGSYTEQISTDGLSKGIYFVKIQSGENSTTNKLIIQ